MRCVGIHVLTAFVDKQRSQADQQRVLLAEMRRRGDLPERHDAAEIVDPMGRRALAARR